jgi:hypothetical protein
VRHMQSFALAAGTLLAIGVGSPALAQSWGAPSRDYARYGIRSVICDERTHAAPCLGLACLDGALALVSAAGGGGPMDGPTRVSTGRTSFSMNFEFDPRAIDRLGVAAAKADLTAAQFEALIEARSITLAAQSDDSLRHRFTTRGLAREWRRVATACARS